VDTSRLLWLDAFGLVALPSNQTLERTCETEALAAGPVDSKASRQMHAAIAEEFPEVVLESYADFIVSPYADT